MAKAIKGVLLKKGKALMANREGKARVFKSKGNSNSFAKNLVRVSNDLKMGDFEFVPLT